MQTPLPIDDALPAITEAVRERGALVLVAEPGAGKTTRVPPAILDAGLAGDGEIVVLEPRRLAARMAARRVAFERGERVGETIGFEVRFDRAASDATRVRFVTEGILTRRLAADPTLRGVSVVVLDEFHERHLHGDVALACLARQRATTRPDLKVVVMSATLDAEPLAGFLGAQVLHVPGRAFPVTIEYDDGRDDRPIERRVASGLRRLVDRGLDGDVLVFLPGAAEIRRAREACEELTARADLTLVVLHGDLPSAEQDRALEPSPKRKVILSTNVAETSLTIEGVVAVIDSGLARVARHSPWSGLQSLEVAKVSRASAAQRAGRAGRTRPGVCLRLYGRHDHDARASHETPEVRRAELCEAVLALRATGERDPALATWFEAPPRAALDAADRLLRRLGAVDDSGAITTIGRRMLSLPVHPRLSRLFIEAESQGVAARGALFAALVSEREIRVAARTSLREGAGRIDSSSPGPGPQSAAPIGTHHPDGRFYAETSPSDLLARLEAFEAAEREGSLNAERCRRHGLDVVAIQAVARVRDALSRRERTRNARGPHGREEEDDDVLLRATLAAFPDRVAKRRTPRAPDVVFAAGGAARLAPTSVVHDAQWMVVVDAEETRGGVVARVASAIEPEWLLDLDGDAVTERRETRFDATHERVELVSALLYEGLALDESRRTDATGPDVSAALAHAAQGRGPAAFCDEGALQRLLLRARFVAPHAPHVPALDDRAVRAVLTAMCEGRRSFRELREASLLDTLVATLPPRARVDLERLAPETLTLPGGRRLHIQYDEGRPPWAESRLQDFFGMRAGPKIAGDRVPLVLHLNAPNGRAVQVTTDLAGFWERHYPGLRKELMRQYPKHAWPEDPRTAAPPAPGRLR